MFLLKDYFQFYSVIILELIIGFHFICGGGGNLRMDSGQIGY